jgi:hypothetical protein
MFLIDVDCSSISSGTNKARNIFFPNSNNRVIISAALDNRPLLPQRLKRDIKIIVTRQQQQQQQQH